MGALLPLQCGVWLGVVAVAGAQNVTHDRLTGQLEEFQRALARFDAVIAWKPSLDRDTLLPEAIEDSAGVAAEEVTPMEPYQVTVDRLPGFEPERESPSAKFFRTGTIAQRVGTRVTTQIWIKGDRGVMLSFSW